MEAKVSSVGLVIDVGRTLISNLSDCSIVYVRCSANQVAHCLPTAAVSGSEMREWKIVLSSFSQ